MTAAGLNTIIREISGGHIVAFFLVLARLTPLFVVAPVFSSSLLIPRVRSILAIAIAIGLTPIASHGQTIPTDPLAVAGLMIEGLLVGFALAFAIATMFAAVQGAGVLADSLSGFSYGSTVDPINGNAGGALTNFYSFLGLAMFLVIGGDAWTLRGLAATFRVIPLGRGPQLQSLVSGAVSMGGTVLLGAIEIAAPILLALVITDIAFGMVSKVVPQINVFAVGFPIKVGVALIVVGVSLPFLGGWMANGLESSVTGALGSLHIA
jgi:flagellar biosynthesis protein FliR